MESFKYEKCKIVPTYIFVLLFHGQIDLNFVLKIRRFKFPVWYPTYSMILLAVPSYFLKKYQQFWRVFIILFKATAKQKCFIIIIFYFFVLQYIFKFNIPIKIWIWGLRWIDMLKTEFHSWLDGHKYLKLRCVKWNGTIYGTYWKWRCTTPLIKTLNTVIIIL